MLNNNRTFQCIINNRCNNNCLFCIDRAGRKNIRKRSFSHDEPKSHLQLIKAIHKAARRTKNIIFTGPEPTLNDALIEYIKSARKAGYTNIRLITNARRLSYMAYAKALIASGLTEIIVSLHGSNKKVHDALTCARGSFEQTTKACENLNILKESNHFEWRINITLNAINAADLPDLFRLALRFKSVTSIGVNTVIPAGKGLVFLNRLSPNYTYLAESFKNAYTAIRSQFAFDNDFTLRKKTFPLVFSPTRSPKRIGLGIVGLPVCLFKGAENLVGSFETALVSKNKTVKIEKKDPDRIKGKSCVRCKHMSACEGVWKPYIKRYGWKEFKPLT
jgi:MoaA/NifB/PqqE/SkfB family radical SAM enzyme